MSRSKEGQHDLRKEKFPAHARFMSEQRCSVRSGTTRSTDTEESITRAKTDRIARVVESIRGREIVRNGASLSPAAVVIVRTKKSTAGKSTASTGDFAGTHRRSCRRTVETQGGHRASNKSCSPDSGSHSCTPSTLCSVKSTRDPKSTSRHGLSAIETVHAPTSLVSINGSRNTVRIYLNPPGSSKGIE